MTEDIPRPDPAAFLREVATASPGWSQPHGGPLGVARHTLILQNELKVQASELGAVRAAAIQDLLVTRSLAEVAALLGVSRQAVSKAATGPSWANARW